MGGPTSYDDDIYDWAHEQAAGLRRLAETRPEISNVLDWSNIADEIEGVARTELHQAESFLRLMLLHLLKLASAPEAPAAMHWRAEIAVSHDDLLKSLSRAIRRKVNLSKAWQLALRQAQVQLHLEGDRLLDDLPRDCPVALEALAADPLDVETARRRIRDSATANG